jgi:hypothetical protein
MAADTKSTGASSRKIKVDELAAKIVADPKTPVDTILVTGFLGDSSEPENIRIYWDASMGSYIDTESADVVHTEPLPKDQSPFGGSYIWLKRSAKGLSGGQGGNAMTGRFFEGPLMAAYGPQFGTPAPAIACAAGTINNFSYNLVCQPTIALAACHSVLFPCVRITLQCPTWPGNYCPVASPGCPGVGPGTPVQGTPVQGQAAAMANPAAAAAFGVHQSTVCSYAPHCWYSYGACPTMFGCGPFHTPGCPQLQARAAQAPAAAGAQALPGGGIVGSYAPHCWYSWNACPSLYGCGPHHTPGCTQFQAQDPAAAAGAQALPGGGIVGSYAPHCWYSWNACPSQYGCGPHHTPGCPQFQAQDPAAAAAGAQAAAAPAIAGSYAPHCWYSYNACPSMFGCGPFHTPNCPR